MRHINGRFALTLPLSLLALAGLLAFGETETARAGVPTEAFLTQIESHQDTRNAWTRFFDALAGRRPAADLVVTVTDTDGNPLTGATVLAGDGEGTPFSGNKLRTDAHGNAAFTSPALRGPVTVTAMLDGYTTTSLIGNQNNVVNIALQKNPDEHAYGFLRGKLNGIPRLGGGSLELGFFIPASRPETLLNFDIASFVSSYNVKVNVFGERDIPGNVVLPTQTKYYTVIPISISKPDFVMPVANSTYAHMYGAGGGISISSAVSLVQKKDFLELVNTFQLTNIGWTRDRVNVHGDETFDVNLSHQVQPGMVTAQISGLGPQKLDAAVITLLDPSGDHGDFVAMDLKTIKSENMQNGGGSVRLGEIRSRRALANSYVFTALFDRNQIQHSNGRWVVGSVQPAGDRSTVPFTRFLSPITAQGVAQANREYKFSNPASAGVTPGMVLINVVSEKNNAETQGKTRTVLWSAVVQGSTDHIVLPDVGHAVLPAPDTAKGETFHWEVTGLRSGAMTQGFNLQAALKDLQDVSTLVQAY
jgi:hypothetical protein